MRARAPAELLLLALLLSVALPGAGVPIPAWRAVTHALAPHRSPRLPAPPGALCARGNLMFWKARRRSACARSACRARRCRAG